MGIHLWKPPHINHISISPRLGTGNPCNGNLQGEGRGLWWSEVSLGCSSQMSLDSNNPVWCWGIVQMRGVVTGSSVKMTRRIIVYMGFWFVFGLLYYLYYTRISYYITLWFWRDHRNYLSTKARSTWENGSSRRRGRRAMPGKLGVLPGRTCVVFLIRFSYEIKLIMYDPT